MTTPNTIRSQLQAAAQHIGRLEAMILLAHVLGKTKEFLIAHDDETLSSEALLRFQMLVSLRASGTPIPYITGKQEFFSRDFAVTDAVLIPRPDTEVLIEQALLVTPPEPHILDLGTGSGCIAITLALEIPAATVTATDQSDAALTIARKNAASLGADIDFRLGHWWDAVKPNETFDLIVSNPPYVHPDDYHLAALGCEPISALTDGVDGLQCLHAVINGAMAHLNPGGWILLEHGYDQGEAVRNALTAAEFAAVRTKQDYGGNDRVTIGRRLN